MPEENLDIKTLNAIAADVFDQAAQGYEVELDPDLADALGAFEEKAITEDDIGERYIPEQDGESDANG